MTKQKTERLNPALFWRILKDITEIPRPSKKEEKIIAYFKDWAAKNGFICVHDQKGNNLVIYIPATKGMEKCKTVILQAHLDMVGEKNDNKVHNFEKDPIETTVKDGWMYANGTTLGADNGVGLAAAAYVAKAKNVKHGPLILLFTSDEETGMNGAKLLDSNLIKDGDFFINLDSETFGDIFIGCAGGFCTKVTLWYLLEDIPAKSTAYRIKIEGLKGGHSGADIGENRANAIQELALLLNNAPAKFELALSKFQGGKAFNAIPREATAVVYIPNKFTDEFLTYVEKTTKEIQQKYLDAEPNLKITAEIAQVQPEYIIDTDTQENLLKGLLECPHGVIAMSKEIKGLVETSTNLASCTMNEEDGYFIVEMSHRSSDEEALQNISERIQNVWDVSEPDEIEQYGEYPGWKPDPDNFFCKMALECFKQEFPDEDGKLKAIHAGLECALFRLKIKIPMISIGPTIENVHTPNERLNIGSTVKFLQFLAAILMRIPEK